MDSGLKSTLLWAYGSVLALPSIPLQFRRPETAAEGVGQRKVKADLSSCLI